MSMNCEEARLVQEEVWKRYEVAGEEIWIRKKEGDEWCRKLNAEKLEYSEWKRKFNAGNEEADRKYNAELEELVKKREAEIDSFLSESSCRLFNPVVSHSKSRITSSHPKKDRA